LLGIQFISYQENIDTSSALEQALFTIVSAVAQLERDLIRERVSAGIRDARASGKKLGRPKRRLDREVILKLKAQGPSLRQIAVCVLISTPSLTALLRTAAVRMPIDPLVRMRTSFNLNDVNLME
jgi:DNA invertase Pin-like site-specific DNA recombinase